MEYIDCYIYRSQQLPDPSNQKLSYETFDVIRIILIGLLNAILKNYQETDLINAIREVLEYPEPNCNLSKQTINIAGCNINRMLTSNLNNLSDRAGLVFNTILIEKEINKLGYTKYSEYFIVVLTSILEHITRVILSKVLCNHEPIIEEKHIMKAINKDKELEHIISNIFGEKADILYLNIPTFTIIKPYGLVNNFTILKYTDNTYFEDLDLSKESLDRNEKFYKDAKDKLKIEQSNFNETYVYTCKYTLKDSFNLFKEKCENKISKSQHLMDKYGNNKLDVYIGNKYYKLYTTNKDKKIYFAIVDKNNGNIFMPTTQGGVANKNHQGNIFDNNSTSNLTDLGILTSAQMSENRI